jgi:hypothetical protein
MLETGVEEEVGVVVESDILALLNCRTLNDSELDNGRRINRSSVAVGYWESACKRPYSKGGHG